MEHVYDGLYGKYMYINKYTECLTPRYGYMQFDYRI